MIIRGIILLVCLLPWTLSLFSQDFERYKRLSDTTIISNFLGFNKKIGITVPLEWQKDGKSDFPVIIIFDSQNERSHNYVLNTIDYLTSNEQMPSCIIASVESQQEYRYLETLHEKSNPKGLATQNERFVFDELIPLLEKNFNASPFRLLIGHSRYGYFTSSLLFSRMNDLNAIISISPFFSQEKVSWTDSLQLLQKHTFSSTKFYRFGIGSDYPEDFLQMDIALKKLNMSWFNAKGVHFKEADHNVTPGLTIGPALYDIFEEWSRIQSIYIANEQKDLKVMDQLESEIVSVYGSRLEFSLGILNGKGWYFYNENQFEKAIEAWEILMRSYPNFSEGYLYILDAQMQLNKKELLDTTIEKFNTSLRTSSFYTEEEKAALRLELEEMRK